LGSRGGDKLIKITIPGKPIPKARHRHGRGGTYSAQKAEERLFRAIASSELGPRFKLLAGALQVDCLFYFKRPKKHYGTGANSQKLKPGVPRVQAGKPDEDNLRKFVLDGLTGIAWIDDAAVAGGSQFKLYDDRGVPRTEIFIKKIDDDWRPPYGPLGPIC
jgi:Holliday junction resolvase RusA-like endonuclease